ncbi:hypothetical protein BVG19_g1066 [[Candida] boidinii]|nr:hypothetical protein BVG19_g1066 [[Candida] boidinii]OWB50675.1 hypothetical protein B5S27_g2227 [[Candida] boidinii]OWB82720.1 hypothetical protein B5S33_g1348 [[Candida] boidinii]
MNLYLFVYLIFYWVPYIFGIYIPRLSKPVLFSRDLEKLESRNSTETENSIGGCGFPNQIYNLIFKGNETNIVESKSSNIETNYKGIILSKYGVNKDEFNILGSLNMTHSIVDIFGQKLPIFTRIKEFNENSTQIINNDYLFLYKEKHNFKNNLNEFFNYISLKKYLLSDFQIFLPKSLFTNSNNTKLWDILIENDDMHSYYNLIKNNKIDNVDLSINILNDTNHVSIYLFEKYGKTSSCTQIGINPMKSYDFSGSLDILQEDINRKARDQTINNNEAETKTKIPDLLLKLKDTIVKNHSAFKTPIENNHLYMGQLADSKEIKVNHKLHDTITDRTISLGVALDLSNDINNLSDADLIKCCPSSIDEQLSRQRVWKLSELSFYVGVNDTMELEHHDAMELDQEQDDEINSTSLIHVDSEENTENNVIGSEENTDNNVFDSEENTDNNVFDSEENTDNNVFDSEENTDDNVIDLFDLFDLSELQEFEAIEMKGYENYFDDKSDLFEDVNVSKGENKNGDENSNENGNENEKETESINKHLNFEIQVATCNGSDKLNIQNA